MNLKEELRSLIAGRLEDDQATLQAYSKDASLFQVMPKLVAFPRDAQDISRLVEFAKSHPGQGISLTARSGGSDMTGGPLSESIVLDMTSGFNKIKELGQGYAVVEPGMFYRDFEKETLKRDLLLPSFPASRELCTLGGMVGNNSGGEMTLSYGKTEKYVESVKVILSDGKEYEVKPLNKEGLQEKMALPTFEGQIYRKVFELIEANKDLLQRAKPVVSKNSAGYALWNVYDEEKGIFDLPKLFVGSQGTLGIITEIRFKLIHPLKNASLLVVFLKDQGMLAEVTQAAMKERPETFELYDDHTLKLAARFFPDFVKILKHNIISLAFEFLPEFFMLLRGGMPKLVLLAEFTGTTGEEALAKAANAKKNVKRLGLQATIAKNKEEMKKYVTIRRESFNLLRHHVKGKRTAPFIDDLVVRAQDLEAFLPKLQEILSQYPKLVYTIAGHVGDGNLHIIPLVDMKDPDIKPMIFELSRRVFDLVFQFKGSMTGEHNDGIIRTPFVEQMFGKEMYEVFLHVKQIFDPQNIFNPGKKVEGSLEYASAHISQT